MSKTDAILDYGRFNGYRCLKTTLNSASLLEIVLRYNRDMRLKPILFSLWWD